MGNENGSGETNKIFERGPLPIQPSNLPLPPYPPKYQVEDQVVAFYKPKYKTSYSFSYKAMVLQIWYETNTGPTSVSIMTEYDVTKIKRCGRRNPSAAQLARDNPNQESPYWYKVQFMNGPTPICKFINETSILTYNEANKICDEKMNNEAIANGQVTMIDFNDERYSHCQADFDMDEIHYDDFCSSGSEREDEPPSQKIAEPQPVLYVGQRIQDFIDHDAFQIKKNNMFVGYPSHNMIQILEDYVKHVGFTQVAKWSHDEASVAYESCRESNLTTLAELTDSSGYLWADAIAYHGIFPESLKYEWIPKPLAIMYTRLYNMQWIATEIRDMFDQHVLHVIRTQDGDGKGILYKKELGLFAALLKKILKYKEAISLSYNDFPILFAPELPKNSKSDAPNVKRPRRNTKSVYATNVPSLDEHLCAKFNMFLSQYIVRLQKWIIPDNGLFFQGTPPSVFSGITNLLRLCLALPELLEKTGIPRPMLEYLLSFVNDFQLFIVANELKYLENVEYIRPLENSNTLIMVVPDNVEFSDNEETEDPGWNKINKIVRQEKLQVVLINRTISNPTQIVVDENAIMDVESLVNNNTPISDPNSMELSINMTISNPIQIELDENAIMDIEPPVNNNTPISDPNFVETISKLGLNESTVKKSTTKNIHEELMENTECSETLVFNKISAENIQEEAVTEMEVESGKDNTVDTTIIATNVNEEPWKKKNSYQHFVKKKETIKDRADDYVIWRKKSSDFVKDFVSKRTPMKSTHGESFKTTESDFSIDKILGNNVDAETSKKSGSEDVVNVNNAMNINSVDKNVEKTGFDFSIDTIIGNNNHVEMSKEVATEDIIFNTVMNTNRVEKELERKESDFSIDAIIGTNKIHTELSQKAGLVKISVINGTNTNSLDDDDICIVFEDINIGQVHQNLPKANVEERRTPNNSRNTEQVQDHEPSKPGSPENPTAKNMATYDDKDLFLLKKTESDLNIVRPNAVTNMHYTAAVSGPPKTNVPQRWTEKDLESLWKTGYYQRIAEDYAKTMANKKNIPPAKNMQKLENKTKVNNNNNNCKGQRKNSTIKIGIKKTIEKKSNVKTNCYKDQIHQIGGPRGPREIAAYAMQRSWRKGVEESEEELLDI